MNYDFDKSRHLGAVLDDPDMFEKIKALGVDPRVYDTHTFLFRDQRTSDALRNSPKPLLEAFQAANFGLAVTSSGAPRGCYPVQEILDRSHGLMRLIDELDARNIVIKQPPPGPFNLLDFFNQANDAKPVEIAQPRKASRGWLRLIGGLLKFVLGVITAIVLVLAVGYFFAR
ncbi:MAG: hypothetical protein AAGC81_13725 [Pseudomonadota bacterium]